MKSVSDLFNQSVTGPKKPRYNLASLVKEYEVHSMEEEVLDPAHPEYWENNPNKGWTPMPDVSEAYAQTLPDIQVMMQDLRGVEDTKPVVLTKIFRDLIGSDPPMGPQGIGDCVSFGNAGGLNTFQAVKIATGNATFKYEEAATESIYALARCEVGKQWNSYRDGAVGAWASKALTTFGCLSRVQIGPYDAKRAKQWGAKGLPDELEPQAKQHIYKSAVMVTQYDQAVQLIQAGYPVVVCSNQGFTMTRDKDGFCKARGTWYHCMYFAGVRFDREGLLCLQSWGPNVPNGPTVLDQPNNSFWVEKDTVAYMLKQRDSYAYNSEFSGFSANDAVLDWSF